MTNVPFPLFGPSGFVSPEESEILAGVSADFNAAFGGNLNPGKSTPQGQLATSLAAVIGAFNDFFVDYTNQVDPMFADGRMQDAIARIYFLYRHGALPTIVLARCNGGSGVTIPIGALARSVDGSIYAAREAGTIGSTGFVDIEFAAVEAGPTDCPAGALNAIYRTIPGWDSITNPAPGVTGRFAENRDAFEERRSLSVAGNATGILPAVRGSVLSVPEVIDAYVTENSSAADQVVGGVTIAAHSIYVCVEGGSDEDVARAIWLKKPPGCNYTGTTSVTVLDTESGYLTPPAYVVKFTRANDLTIDFEVTVSAGSDVPSDAPALIQNAIEQIFPSIARIGQKVYASQFAAAIGALGPWVRLVSIEVNSGPVAAADIDEMPTLGSVTTVVS